MPTFEQGHFIERALESLLSQTLGEWELVIVDDGSKDDTLARVRPYLSDPRIRLSAFPENRGLGHALNAGLDASRSNLIAYLPSDDVYYRDHLSSLVPLFADPSVRLACSGLKHHYNRSSPGRISGSWLQLVQVMHRRSKERWVERSELESDDLDRLFFRKIDPTEPVSTGRVTCEWVDHPGQRHKVMQEPLGGINPFRVRYRVQQPLRFHTSVGNLIDEPYLYARFRQRPPSPPAPDSLRILLVGELAYNPERVLALEERGHRLYGLWTPEPYWFNAVGPMPFGHVEDLPRERWRETVEKLRPDLIYALLNWQAVPFVHHVLTDRPKTVPLVWHFKEGPFICLEKGMWPELLELYEQSQGQIYISPEMRDWFRTVLPASSSGRSLILDGDLPKREWLDARPSARLSASDGQIHTVVPGRPIGLHPENVGELAVEGVHLHFYGDFTQGQWRRWIEDALRLAPAHLHLHPQVSQDRWVEEFSRYDAGWLHFLPSENRGELGRAIWDDLNYPARISTLAAAGLPLIQYDNSESVVATQSLSKELGVGLFGRSIAEVAAKLRDEQLLTSLQGRMWEQRMKFTFDHHADRLLQFFREVIKAHRT